MYRGRIPRDKDEFQTFTRHFADQLQKRGASDNFLVEAGASLSEKLSKFVGFDKEAMEYDAKKKVANEKKYAIWDEMFEEISRTMSYLEFKLGKTSAEMNEYGVRPRR
ncbi:MAG: hypothetical protein PHQ23_08920 [Candidatus Wallbacteria bacterium]|nr:hypothetical protein [Candidatus Wallbacteria bacterium]